MNNDLILKFMEDNNLGKFDTFDVICGLGLKDKLGNTILIVKPPFTENLIECYFDNKKTSYQLKKGIDNNFNWFIVN